MRNKPSRRKFFAALSIVSVIVLVYAFHATNRADGPVRWVSVAELSQKLMLLESVFWEPLDSVNLRKLLIEKPELVRGKSVLEIGTGSGLIAICCLEAGAASVMATDVNPAAIRAARYNLRRYGRAAEVKQVLVGEGVDSGAFSVVPDGKRFDLIISNPPWEDASPKQWSEYALYDPNFQLLRSMLEGSRSHLNPGGRLLLAFGCVEAIRVLRRLADELDMTFLILDERDPEDLPDLFLPGMLIGILPDQIYVD